MPAAPRDATPSDAKAVWDSIVKAKGKPTFGLVVKALNASGQFLPVNKTTIKRWHDRGWKKAKTKHLRKPALEEAAARLDASVPALTGNATTRTQDIVGKPSAPKKKGDGADPPPTGEGGPPPPPLTPLQKRAREIGALLDAMTDAELMTYATRQAFRTAAVLLTLVEEHPDMLEQMPRELGSLQQALAGSLVAANGTMNTMLDLTDRLMKTVPGSEASAGADDDPLKLVWDEYDRKAREA